MYFHTDSDYDRSVLLHAVSAAVVEKKSLRIDVDSEGRLRFKVGEGMWSAPIDSTHDSLREPQKTLPPAAQTVIEQCVAEAWVNHEASDVHTQADIAADIVERLHRIYGVETHSAPPTYAWYHADGSVCQPSRFDHQRDALVGCHHYATGILYHRQVGR